MREIATVPIDRLVNDVAVDSVHVRELADSIKTSGPISPPIVQKGTLALVDGFHRVAAMQELGFDRVECFIVDCDTETFWDMRMIQASTHKAITFARVVDWIDEVFKLAPAMQRYQGNYKNAASLFNSVDQGTAPEEVRAWGLTKAQQWGLSVSTVRQWLYMQQSLAPELLEEAKSPTFSEGVRDLHFAHYQRVGATLAGRPDLQKEVIAKARQEGLTADQTMEVSRAVRQAPDREAVQTILRQPMSRTADDLVRGARVARLVNEPRREPSPQQVHRNLTGRALEVYLDLQQQVHNIDRLSDDAIDALSPSQRSEMLDVVDELTAKLQDFRGRLGRRVGGRGRVVEGQLVEGR